MGEPLNFDQLDFLRRERLALSRLTEQQKLFCEEWVRSFDTIAALRAGKYWLPKTMGGSQAKLIQKKFDSVMASEAVQQYILLLKESIASRLGVSMDAIVEEYRSLAFLNMDDYVNWTPTGITIKSSGELTRAQKAGIMEITETRTKGGTVVKLKLYPKQPALDRLFEILKELEAIENSKDNAPAKVSQTQINLILQDPVMRRAVEHLALNLMDKPIHLVGNDKDRIAFDDQIRKITQKFMEPEHGIVEGRTGDGSIGGPESPQAKQIESQGGSTGDYRYENSPEEDTGAEERHVREDTGEGSTSDDDDEQPEEERRYPVDGL